MVWLEVPGENVKISFEKIEAFKWDYPDLRIIQIKATINDADYLIYSKEIISDREANSFHNSLINKISENGLDENEIHIEQLRKNESDMIFKKIFELISDKKSNEILNLNHQIK